MKSSLLEIEFPTFQGKILVLGYYYGNSVHLIDSVKLDYSGKFEINKDLHEGMYVLLFPDSSAFEFILTDPSRYRIYETEGSSGKDIILIGNPIAEAYVYYQTMIQSYSRQLDSLRRQLIPVHVLYEEEVAIQNQVDSLSNSFINKYKASLPAQFVKAMKAPQFNDGDTGFMREGFSRERFYFKNIDWSDQRLIYTPVIEAKINTYLDKLASENSMVMINTIDTIINLPRSIMLREFVFGLIFSKYSSGRSTAMNEFIYLHLLDSYIINKEFLDLNEMELKKLQQEYSDLKKLALNSTAPDIKLPDNNGKEISFYSIEANYCILFFWDYNCEDCRRVLTELVKLTSRYNYMGIKVYTVCTSKDKAIWEAFLAKKIPSAWINTINTKHVDLEEIYNINTLPALFVLDNKKTIINKNLTIPELDAFFFRKATNK